MFVPWQIEIAEQVANLPIELRIMLYIIVLGLVGLVIWFTV
jgi:hypothetical protein